MLFCLSVINDPQVPCLPRSPAAGVARRQNPPRHRRPARERPSSTAPGSTHDPPPMTHPHPPLHMWTSCARANTRGRQLATQPGGAPQNPLLLLPRPRILPSPLLCKSLQPRFPITARSKPLLNPTPTTQHGGIFAAIHYKNPAPVYTSTPHSPPPPHTRSSREKVCSIQDRISSSYCVS